MFLFGFSARAGALASGRVKMERAPARWRARGFAAIAAGLIAYGLAALGLPASALASARLYMQSGGVTRSAVVIQHAALKLRRRPLIIVLRPRNGGVRRHRLAFQEIVESRKPVFLYPEPLAGGWPVAAGPNADRDTLFLHDLINRFVNAGVGDPRKIFLVGEASGGVFAFRAICGGVGHSVAGIATLGAAMPADLAHCAGNPTAYIAVNNVANPNVPFGGGHARFVGGSIQALPAEETLAMFARRAGCGAKREERPLIEHDSHGVARARGAILSYAGCRTPVELLRIATLTPHTGSKTAHPAAPPASEGHNFDAARKVWEFLKRNGA
ncbi:hypothetical protein K9U33_01755 [Rhodoblastus acidophilus]|uniref:Polyhydroxybutyrate depolymerase n=1 Tax=Candidatus Rhodoblastus alkanivorans TaxID=2954117 RepID=A0ABS9Z427_9HYPH|nr:hypothetical protein [Candidatus Rhodoblastus alkanivorans]MCI4677380.1 hypothetical protein [Candidatus Rhodoblastus alkanivorans]MCI4682115.1 hypothetical protein [Candidatus Rhodoblastus alkanivorans]